MGLLLTAVLAASLVRAASYDVEAAGASFRRDGFAVLEGFAGADEVAAMKGAMAELEAGYWASPQAAQATVFRTDAGQSGAQAQSRYFFDSADATHFFEEPDGKRLNKAGHALHLRRDAFGAYSRSAKVATLLRALGYVRPVLPQSMYIFKPPAVGGSVTSHQDASFLRTAPAQTVAGLWLALDDATLANGCLWVRNGSHVEPVRRLFVRDGERLCRNQIFNPTSM
jgi:phytanoyl-CoA hydroxylase